MYFDLYDEDTEGARPPPRCVRPQERDQQYTVAALSTASQPVPHGQPTAQSSHCRSSKCPTSHLHPVLGRAGPLLSKQNSWWKCRGSSLILLCCSGLWSKRRYSNRGGETSVFKVFPPRQIVLQRSLPLRNAVLSGLWSRSWIVVCLLAAFKTVQGSSASSSSSQRW